MSWNELERLVRDTEVHPDLMQVMRSCRTQDELVVTASSLGYQITRIDLLRAWQEYNSSDLPSASGA